MRRNIPFDNMIVSIHAPTRGATHNHKRPQLDEQFQSTRPRGARLHLICSLFLIALFQSTRPRGARRGVQLLQLVLVLCFNPRAHAGRDDVALKGAQTSYTVSIHAPTRGATLFHLVPFLFQMVSIHAPTRGATNLIPRVNFSGGFNPRAHAGRDYCKGCCNIASVVSIHAPTRGATYRCGRYVDNKGVSIHAPTRGATCFNCRYFFTRWCFNPRAHAGRDT